MSEENNKKVNEKIADVLRTAFGTQGKHKFTSALILAAGLSVRMGQSKQLIEIDGLPVVARTVLEFEKADTIDEIIIVALESELDYYNGFAEKYGIKKPLLIVKGGETRQDSARLGSDAVHVKSKFICIHDAARCLITAELIDKVCKDAWRYGGSCLAIKATDTIKISGKSDYIEATPDRTLTWQAQTPQVFDANAYRGGAYIAQKDNVKVTDDCMLLENVGYPVHLVEGAKENIKITEPIDIAFAEAVLKIRKESVKE